ncbi:periplasmic heavy metal sensor [Limibaculum sp. FT325]|uniref:periplasmic heavy metal sensor n=1 Tax=Thermohalobaculum sediminis TaxID=2939436 RepID=UPI0020BFC8AD|nr:periplasmic heavy metal sensor [Limibaculum sediminis]MCL5775764.1 periplasmic heavy metal sensor [Limibaculum sediminis]
MSADTNVATPAGRPGCPLWLRALLVVSLAGNLAVLGLVGGWSMRDHHWHDRDRDGLDPRQARLLRALPEARQDEARAMMLAGRDAMAAERASIEAAQREIVAVIRAPDFTPERLSAALGERREASGRLNGIVHAQFVTIATGLTPAERAEMADRIEEAARRWADRRAGR